MGGVPPRELFACPNRAGIAPRERAARLRPTSALACHAACEAAPQTPTPSRPVPAARLARRLTCANRCARRAAGLSRLLLAFCPPRNAQRPGAAPGPLLSVLAQHTTAVKQSSGRPTSDVSAHRAGSPKEASRRPAALLYRGLYAVARSRRASRPTNQGLNQTRPGAALPNSPLLFK